MGEQIGVFFQLHAERKARVARLCAVLITEDERRGSSTVLILVLTLIYQLIDEGRTCAEMIAFGLCLSCRGVAAAERAVGADKSYEWDVRGFVKGEGEGVKVRIIVCVIGGGGLALFGRC